MDHSSFTSWMNALKRAWEGREWQAARQLFTENCFYHKNPFDAPLHGVQAIQNYWEMAAKSEEQISFNYEVLSATDKVGVAHWWATFCRVPSDMEVDCDGVMHVELDDDNQCYRFRAWWLRKEQKRPEYHE
jgi:hypothetical protein